MRVTSFAGLTGLERRDDAPGKGKRKLANALKSTMGRVERSGRKESEARLVATDGRGRAGGGGTARNGVGRGRWRTAVVVRLAGRIFRGTRCTDVTTATRDGWTAGGQHLTLTEQPFPLTVMHAIHVYLPDIPVDAKKNG